MLPVGLNIRSSDLHQDGPIDLVSITGALDRHLVPLDEVFCLHKVGVVGDTGRAELAVGQHHGAGDECVVVAEQANF